MAFLYITEAVTLLLIIGLIVRIVGLYITSVDVSGLESVGCVESYIDMTTSSRPEKCDRTNVSTAIVTGPLPVNPLRPRPMVSSADAGSILKGYIDDFLNEGDSAPQVLEKRSVPPVTDTGIKPVESIPVRVVYNSLNSDFSFATPS